MTQDLPEGTVTVLFTDVEGSTDLTTRRGDEAAQEILRAQRELVRQQVEEHSGHEVKSLGDGFMVAFASARRAVACAAGIQRALAEHNSRQPLDQQVRVRIGLNTGEVIQEEADLFGEAVNAAARIAAKAEGGQILASDAVKAVMGRVKDVELVDRGRFRLKGFPERWRLFEVVWQEETAAAPALLERTPFVGREAEQAELRRCLDQAARGKGALVMIGGEPGVGKTRLAEELAVEARQRGLLTLTGQSYEMEGAPPYIPFVEMLEATARIVPREALREALGESAPEVARLMPELRRLFPDIAAPLELPPEQERRYLFNSVQEFLERAGRAQPLVLTLEDLHWADDSTMLLLQHIAQRLSEMPLLILGTYRDVELDVARPLARALEELLRQRLAHRLAVRRLPEASVAAMLQALSGQEPPTSLVQAVYSETEGNPFFVEEVFKHLAEEGRLFDAQGRWRSDLSISELEVPEGVRLVVSRRLERVSEDCRHVLTTAAVIGRGFGFELLEALGEVEADVLLDAVDEGERAHLITSAGDGPEARFTFAHELIRQTLLSGLSLPRRQRLHLRVAEAMERVYARALEERAADLAHHLYQAGSAADPQKTAHYLALAAERAFGAAAFEDALRLYDSALSLQPAEDRRGCAELLHKRGMTQRSLGRWEEALADWREALTAYEELGDAEAVGGVSSDITVQLLWGARYVEALQISRRGLVALGERVSTDRCRLLGCGGMTLSMAGYYTAGDGMITQAVALAQELGDERLLGEARRYKTGHHYAYMQLREVVDTGRRTEGLLRSTGDLWRLASVLWYIQWALLFLGRLDETVEIGEELEPLASRLGHLGALLIARRVRAVRDLMVTADIDSTEEFARGDLELCRSADMPWISLSYSWLGLAHFWRGRWEEALEHSQQAVKLEPPGFIAGGGWSLLFLWRAYAGDREAALAMLEQRCDKLPRLGQPNTLGAWPMLSGVVEGLAVLAEQEEAAKLYPLVLEAIDTGVLTNWANGRLFQSVAGMAAAAGGQWDVAEEHYQTALRQAHELPIVLEQPEVRRWYARMLVERDEPGDREKARELLTEAVAMYGQIGMPKHVEMAEALLREV
ncbi:MAG: AAA family ATPase [Dehalococcoidia bacterium]|nr:MAG: AAA family ATPase [Dehalococcoidia bacterium]